ncbi:MAG: type I-E CRISPR-associated protein Cse1/CasA [Acidobacteriota bacterium]|nr:type I-E CRISPR-associated protein Cse1/CasA [Acidobacteriota bacterium]
MSNFNLIEKPWIPCLMSEGDNKIRELGLKDILINTHNVKEIVDNSPFVAVSIHRLLLAILHRNFGPNDFDEWKDLWRKGKFDEQVLKSYFEKWKDRFYLFDDERPFYQYPKVEKTGGKEADIAPLELLMQEKASGNNATLFDHSSTAISKSYLSAKAARYLITRQAFSFGGGVSSPFNLANSTMISGFSTLAISEENLFETLTLNMVIYNPEQNQPIIAEKDEDDESLDIPFWEREKLSQSNAKEKDGTLPLGYLDYLTWQSRRIKLIADENSENVIGCQLQQNYKLYEGDKFFDPFKVYVSSKESGFYPLNLNPNKSLWRNSYAILKQKISGKEQGGLFDHLAQINLAVARDEIEGKRKYLLSIFGVINDKANVLLWSQERMPLPLDYLDDAELLSDLQESIQFAEEIGKILRSSMRKLASELSAEIADSFPAVPFYWSELETEFNNLLLNLPDDREEAKRKWFVKVGEIAEKGFEKTADSLSGSATEQKAIVKAEGLFFGLIKKYLNNNSTHKDYFPKYKTKGGEE